MTIALRIADLFPEGTIDELLWLDYETTGLSERRDVLLEIGMIKTDCRLRVIAEFEAVISVPGVRSLPMVDLVRDMHEASGLFDACERSRLTLRQVEDLALAWTVKNRATGLYAAGSGVHFDRRWAKEHMPRFEAQFHYRDFDLTTLRRFFGTEKREAPHRALADLRINVEDMRQFVALRDLALAVA